MLVDDGRETSTTTSAATVGAFLHERRVAVRRGDFVSAPLGAPLIEGMQIVRRGGVPVTLVIGRSRRIVRSGAATVGELLVDQHVRVAATDVVEPESAGSVPARGLVRVIRIERWTSHVAERLRPALQQHYSRTLALGTTRTISVGRPGVRVATLRFVRRNGVVASKTLVSYRIVRAAKPRIVVHGLANESALEHLASQGFTGALRFAGAALHVIATAYTAGCYGCSGITKSGVRAGHGIIAVDPRFIPLGTRLFVPGYGRAIAGDTGGAIVGNRVDLGMNRVAEALNYGRRSVTVYVVK